MALGRHRMDARAPCDLHRPVVMPDPRWPRWSQVSVPPDTTLFRAGDPANELYIVAGGALDLRFERGGNGMLEAARTVGQARPSRHVQQQCLLCLMPPVCPACRVRRQGGAACRHAGEHARAVWHAVVCSSSCM